jgi:hypothetical protein
LLLQHVATFTMACRLQLQLLLLLLLLLALFMYRVDVSWLSSLSLARWRTVTS